MKLRRLWNSGVCGTEEDVKLRGFGVELRGFLCETERVEERRGFWCGTQRFSGLKRSGSFVWDPISFICTDILKILSY